MPILLDTNINPGNYEPSNISVVQLTLHTSPVYIMDATYYWHLLEMTWGFDMTSSYEDLCPFMLMNLISIMNGHIFQSAKIRVFIYK